MSQTLKLSVILPVAHYNIKWLDRAITSTEGIADELIVVADESSAQLPILRDNPLVHHVMMVRTPGTARATNAGVATATGDYISLLCSDDWYDKAGMMQLKEIAVNNYGNFDVFGGQTQAHGQPLEGIWPKHGCLDYLHHQNNIAASSIFMKQLWYHLWGFADVRYNDWHFWKRGLELYECLDDHQRSDLGFYYFEPVITYHFQCWPGQISAGLGYRSDLGHDYTTGPREILR